MKNYVIIAILLCLISCKKEDTTIYSYSCQCCITRESQTCGPTRIYKETQKTLDANVNGYNKTYIDPTDKSLTIYTMTCTKIQ